MSVAHFGTLRVRLRLALSIVDGYSRVSHMRDKFHVIASVHKLNSPLVASGELIRARRSVAKWWEYLVRPSVHFVGNFMGS